MLLGFAPSVGLALWYAVSMIRGRLTPGAFAVDVAQAEDTYGLGRFAAYKVYTFLKAGPYHNFVFASGGDAAVRPVCLLGRRQCRVRRAAHCRGGRGAPDALACPLYADAANLDLRPAVHPSLPGSAPLTLGRHTGERFLYPGFLLLLVFLLLHRLMLRALAMLALYFAVGFGGLASGTADWSVPVDPNWEAPGSVLFLHRSTTFIRKLEEVRRSEAASDMPRLPLAFETSILLQVSRPAR